MAQKMIRPLRSEAEYHAAIQEIERYFDNEPKPATAEADRFDLLAVVVEDYERKRWPIAPPDAVDAMRASDILTGKRHLTIRMAWRLHTEWGIPAKALITQPRRERPAA